MEKDLGALEKEDPLSIRPPVWYWVFVTASEHFKVSIQKILGLGQAWEQSWNYSNEQTQLVIDAACQNNKLSEDKFWKVVKKRIQKEREVVSKKLEERRREVDRQLLLVSLPSGSELDKIQKYEAHICRLIFKSLHELQRLQAARQSLHPSAPLAVDIDINTSAT